MTDSTRRLVGDFTSLSARDYNINSIRIKPNPHLKNDTGLLYRIFALPFKYVIPIIPFILKPLARAIILPAINEHKNDKSSINLSIEERRKFKVIRNTIVTYDGAQLDAIELATLEQNKNPQEQCYVINFCGNFTMYQNTKHELCQVAEELRAVAVGFNYRGVATSSGMPNKTADLVVDGIAVVQDLLDRGVKPEHIVLKSTSIGAAIATRVAAYFHDENIKINLFNDRSFSSLANVAVGGIRTYKYESGHRETKTGKLLGYLAKPFIILLLKMLEWEMEAATAWKRIPEKNKTFIVARSSKLDRQTNEKVLDDITISHYGSLYSAIKEKLPKNHPRRVQRKANKFTYEIPPENRDEEKSAEVNYDLHHEPMTKLLSRGRQRVNAQQFFMNFARQAFSEEEKNITIANQYKKS